VGLSAVSKAVGLMYNRLGIETSFTRHNNNNQGNIMGKPKEVFDKAYGNVPHEVGFNVNLDINVFRGFKYYYLKMIRFFR